jgi:hypothetical protein
MKVTSFALLLLTAIAAHANLINNGSFETNPAANSFAILPGGDTTSLPGWTVTGSACGSNCMLILTNTYTESSNLGTLTFQPQDGNQSLDLTGSFNSLDGGISQSVTTTPGTQYMLTFFLGNMDDRVSAYGSPSALQVLLNGTVAGTFSNDNSTNNQLTWAQESLNFTATAASTTIDFVNNTVLADNEAGLDNVSLDVASASQTPEPSALLLVAMGFGLVVWGRRVLQGA